MTRRSSADKPDKPYPTFPLTAHNSGQWAKKIAGKLYYFGPWDDPQAAIAAYKLRLPELTGERTTEGITLEQLANEFLHSRRLRADTGRLSMRTWHDYELVAKRLVSVLGRSRAIDSLGPRDFERVLESLPKSWSLKTLSNFIIRAGAIFRFATVQGLVESPIRLGDAFRRPSDQEVRVARANRPAKFFSADECRRLVAAASPEMAAMILLGLNAAYGNADCGRMRMDAVSVDGWLAEPRGKTGVPRIAKLWQETLAAIDTVRPRTEARAPGSELMFATTAGNPYWIDNGHDPIATQFYRLVKRMNLQRSGAGFYSFRHVSLTIGERACDPLACGVLMGHVDPSMASHYREHFDRERVAKVCDVIREWYLSE